MFLGWAATWYTLLFGFSAFTVLLMAVLLAGSRWRRHGFGAALDPLRRLAAIAAIAAAIGSITWLPFLLRVASSPVSNSGSAFHYLPADGAVLTFPMLQFSLLGAVCLLGALWLVVRARSSVRAGGLAIGVLAVYLWSLLSMLTTLARTTLLSFRLQPTLTVLLVAAGAFGFVEAVAALAPRSRVIAPVAGAIGLAAAIAFSQDIPDVLRPDLTIAYTDTDGYGQRGDRRPPSSEKFYAAIDATILKVTGKPRDQIVVMTADYSFLSDYPYWGFQGLTSHYANPLAQFDLRAAQIEKLVELRPPTSSSMRWTPRRGPRRPCFACVAARTRNRRDESASAFAADVQHDLSDEPVEACPPSARYRLKKYVRRNRRLLVPMAVVAMVLMAGTLVSAWQAWRASDAERRASSEAAIVRAVNDFHQDLLSQVGSDPKLHVEVRGDRNLTVGGVLDPGCRHGPWAVWESAGRRGGRSNGDWPCLAAGSTSSSLRSSTWRMPSRSARLTLARPTPIPSTALDASRKLLVGKPRRGSDRSTATGFDYFHGDARPRPCQDAQLRACARHGLSPRRTV